MSKRKFKHWITLNKEGKELYSEVFPNGEIPVVSMIPTVCRIEKEPQRCYMIYHEELSEEEFERFIENISKRFDATKKEIIKHISTGKFEDRIPIREKYVSSAGTNHPGLFI